LWKGWTKDSTCSERVSAAVTYPACGRVGPMTPLVQRGYQLLLLTQLVEGLDQ
jgi:hypothetical protein